MDVQLDDNSVFIQHKAIIPTYRIPEHSIRFNFMRRFGTLGQLAREQYKEEELHSSGNTSSGGDDGRVRIPSQLKHFYGPITRQTRRSPASTQQHSSVSTQQQQQHYQPPDDEQSRLWLTCLSRFYDEIYHYSIAKQQQQPLTGTVEQAESPQNPFESINDLDYLYRVALGQLPQHTSAASHPIADYTQDPLFTQFMAWKQLNIIQRKHDSISQHLYSNQSAADNNSNRRQSPRSNKNRSPTHNK